MSAIRRIGLFGSKARIIANLNQKLNFPKDISVFIYQSIKTIRQITEIKKSQLFCETNCPVTGEKQGDRKSYLPRFGIRINILINGFILGINIMAAVLRLPPSICVYPDDKYENVIIKIVPGVEKKDVSFKISGRGFYIRASKGRSLINRLIF